MQILASDDAKRLAKSFRSFSSFLGDYRFINWDTLTDSDRAAMRGFEWTLLNFSLDITTKAIDVSCLTMADSLSALKEVAMHLDRVIVYSTSDRKVIGVAKDAAALATSVTLGNEDAVLESAERLLATVW